jgi:hypothetical protein
MQLLIYFADQAIFLGAMDVTLLLPQEYWSIIEPFTFFFLGGWLF